MAITIAGSRPGYTGENRTLIVPDPQFNREEDRA
jgi:hypothetical protein